MMSGLKGWCHHDLGVCGFPAGELAAPLVFFSLAG